MPQYPELVQMPGGAVVKVRLDDFQMFVRGGVQYLVDMSEWADTPQGYAHPCEALGPP